MALGKIKRVWWQFTGVLIFNTPFIGPNHFAWLTVPVLNCYACPLAQGACPIGTIQYFLVIGMTLLVSALNVFFRDLQHLITIVMMVWFFGTPIIYPLSMVPENFQPYMKFINPMTIYASYYRNIFYYVKYPEGSGFPSIIETITALGITLLIFFIGYFVFKKLEPRFAEEI